MTTPTLRHLGPSSDGRTNRWEITPGCGHKPFEPRTTVFVIAMVDCPKCGAHHAVNYNERTVRICQ